MNKTIIYFLRHGEVENPKKILYGRLPGFSLSESGKREIGKVAQEIKDKNIEYLYTSPMLRAKETAQIIGKQLKLKPKISRFLIESKLLHTGMPLEIFKKYIQPELYGEKYVKLGQESSQAQAERMYRFVKMVITRNIGKNILAVSHGDPIVILKAKIMGIPFSWQFKKENYVKPGNYMTLVCEGNKYRFG